MTDFYHRKPVKPGGQVQTTPPAAVDRQTPPLTPRIIERFGCGSENDAY
jgi:hypothetical protein